MPNIDLSFVQNPNILMLALGAGLLPAILWILFWVKESRERPRPAKMIFISFIIGAGTFILALIAENIILQSVSNPTTVTALFAVTEEVLKFLVFFLILARASMVKTPIDFPVYMMIVALGFAGLENAMYFLSPVSVSSPAAIVASSSMRFLGTTLMHAAASSLAGIGLGFAYFSSRGMKFVAAIFGLGLAILVHLGFTLFIPGEPNTAFFAVIVSLWLLTIIIIVFLERLRAKGHPLVHREHHLIGIARVEAPLEKCVRKAGMRLSDTEPVLEGLMRKGFSPDGAEHDEFERLLILLRKEYAKHLMKEGVEKGEAGRTAHSRIRDTVSPKALSDIFTTLKRSE